MQNKLNVFIFGDYQPHSADGLLEFGAQNANLLKDEFQFHFIRFLRTVRKGTYYEERVDGHVIHSFGSKNTSRLVLPASFRKWLEKLEAGNKIFHLNHIYTYNNYVVAKTLVRKRIPYLITPHDSYVYGDVFRKTKPFFRRVYRDILVDIADKYVLKHAQVIHELTDRNLSVLHEITSTDILVVPNQIRDMEVPFIPEHLEARICFIGRFDIFQKGIDLALQAFSRFRQMAGDELPEVQFVLIGPADEAAASERMKISQKLGLNVGTEVLFTGKIPENERNAILERSKVYLQLSRFEGFGLSVLQALSSWKPVIISPDIPISEKVMEYGAGFIVGSAQEAADALRLIFSMPEADYIRMASNARRCFENEFHSNIVKEKLVQLYYKTASI